MSSLFGPLDKEYCKYFYFVSIFAFVIFIVAFVSLLFTLVLMKSKDKWFLFWHSTPALASMLLTYFTNRLLYSMCIGSIK